MSGVPALLISRVYRFVFVTLLLTAPLVFYYDRALFDTLNCRPGWKAANFFFLLMTSLADGLWVMMIVTIIQSVRPRNFKALIIAMVIGNILLHSAKYFVAADRPLRALGETAMCYLGQPLTLRSFPSGHAFSVGIFFMFARPHRSLPAAVAVSLIACLAVLSRVYVGAHFPRDILTGFLLGVLAFAAGERLAGYISFRETSLGLRKALVAFLGLAIALVYIYGYHEKTQELEYLLTPAAWLIVLYWLLYGVGLMRAHRRSV